MSGYRKSGGNSFAKSKKFRKEVAELFIQGLENDGLNWKKGWITDNLFPENASTNKQYKGVNKLYLFMMARKNGYEDSRWMTFKQIKDAGYHLEKGAKGSKVEYFLPFDGKERHFISWDYMNDLIKSGKRLPGDIRIYSKLYTVFNGQFIEGLPEKEKFVNKAVAVDEMVTKIAEGMGVEVTEKDQGMAYYSQGNDSITMPKKESFISSDEYNYTLLHELSHATGAEKRLNREQTSYAVDKEGYAFEELVAEVSSAFMGRYIENREGAEIPTLDNHQAYINNWIEQIRKDPEVLMKAIKEADKAAIYMEYKAEIILEQDFKKEMHLGEPKEAEEEKTAEKELETAEDKEQAEEAEM